MKQVTSEYKASMKQNVRNRSTMLVAIGDINPEMQLAAEVTDTNLSYYSAQHTGRNSVVFKDGSNFIYSTLEQDFTKADGSMLFVPRETETEAYFEDTGMVTSDVYTEENTVSAVIDFPTNNKLTPMSIGVEFVGEIPENSTINISYSEGGSVSVIMPTRYRSIGNKLYAEFTHTYSNLPDTVSLVIRGGMFEESDKLSRRMRISAVTFGDGTVISSDIIESANTNYYSSRTNEELPTSDLTVNIVNYNARYDADNPDNPLAILDNKNQEINVYYGYDVTGEDSYEWVKGCSVLSADWNSKQHTATIMGQDRFREDDTLFIHSYNTLHEYYGAEHWIWYALSRMAHDIPFEYTELGGDTNGYISTSIVETKPCKEVIQQVASICNQTMLWNADGRLVFKSGAEETLEEYETDTLNLNPLEEPVEETYVIPDVSIGDNAIITLHVKGYDYKMSRQVDVIKHIYMNEDTANNRYFWTVNSDIEYVTTNVRGTCYVTTSRVYNQTDYFNMGKEDVLEDMVANKEDKVGEIIVPYYSAARVATETTEVASIIVDISDSEIDTYKFDVDLGGTIYTNKYVYQCDAESEIPLTNFYEDSTINRTTGARDTDTHSTCSGFRAVTSGDYFRIACDDDKIITGYGEYSTNATSGFIRWVDINDDKCVKKMHSNCSYIRVEIRYPDDSSIDVSDLEKVRLAQATRLSYKTPNDYAIVTVNKFIDYPNVDELEIFVTAKGYINFTATDVVKTVGDGNGKTIRWENPIISTKAEANRVANDLVSKLSDNIVYDYQYRGNPEIEVGDIMKQENDFVSDMKVYVEEHKISFNGALSGEIKTKRRYSL